MPVKGRIPAQVIREHKKDRCDLCGITAEQAKSKGGLGLHHRDMDRSNNTAENLITVCASCHTREHWLKGSKKGTKKAFRCYACATFGINRKADKKGLCETHRTRARRLGNPYFVKRKIGKQWIVVDERKEKGIT